MKNFIYLFLFFATIIQAHAQFKEVDSLLKSITNIISGSLTTLLMGAAFVAFLFAVIGFILARAKGKDTGLKDAKNRLLWTTFGLFIMVAVWGLVNFIEMAFLGQEIRTIKRPQTSWNTQQSSSPSSNKIPKGGSCQILTDKKDNCASGLICTTSNDRVGEYGECTTLY